MVGTHELYAYERMAAVQISSGHLATGDVDLLYDARARLKLLGSDVATVGLAGLLRHVDHSFVTTGAGSFRAVNRDGFMVDLIQPLPPDRMAQAPRSRIGTAPDDLVAVEIQGPAWLVNSPKIETIVIDARGYPLRLVTPDPRAFALHKAWLADRSDRDPLKRRRDFAQARVVAELVATRLPHLRFDDPALGALPKALRARAAELGPAPRGIGSGEEERTPDW
ncbi:nucleotidyltransferase domain-containing protein [Hyphomicrobiales bacterium BP6-180914]|uniref:Nucleotidyltransferase domain-containing protein n=1 Tax=Lichenifustis flavocetrariae TaxID=2949735 RepID=A0AA41Z1R2_9HYPH|nr:nucleotidyltransferase domain-containing protein [Lichenifustis flavocetrariae]MCW6507677.1 nucleotidyltransferase domain-containing protein [Lichenifustis flavocetrariae]